MTFDAKQKHRAEDDGKTLDQRLSGVRTASTAAAPKFAWQQKINVHPAADEVPAAGGDDQRKLRG